MRKNIFFAISLTYGICSLAGCSKESPVIEKKSTSMALNAFTVDTYRFRVSLDDQVVTDSLLTPEGAVGKVILFNDYQQRLKVYNTSDETLLIDIPYTLGVGRVNVFTIYQTQAGTQPFYLTPSPGEPKPSPGKGKLSIIGSGQLPGDSIKAVVEVGSNPVETLRLKKDDFSRFFEIAKNSSFKVTLYTIPGNNRLGERLFQGNTLNADFVIYRLTYLGGTTLGAQQLY